MEGGEEGALVGKREEAEELGELEREDEVNPIFNAISATR